MDWNAVAAIGTVLGVVATVSMWLWDKRRARYERGLVKPVAELSDFRAAKQAVAGASDSAWPGAELTEADTHRPRAPLDVVGLRDTLRDASPFERDHVLERYSKQTFRIEGPIRDIRPQADMTSVTITAAGHRDINISVYFPASTRPRLEMIRQDGWSLKCDAELYLGAIRADEYSLWFYKPTWFEVTSLHPQRNSRGLH